VAGEGRLASRAPLSSPLDAQAATAVVGRGLSGSAQATAQVEAPESSTPIGTAPRGRTASEIFLRDQRILLAPNELTVDFGLFYARNDELVLGSTGSVPTLGQMRSSLTANRSAAIRGATSATSGSDFGARSSMKRPGDPTSS